MNDKQADKYLEQIRIEKDKKIITLLEKLFKNNYKKADVIELKELLEYPLTVNELETLIKGCIVKNPACLKATRGCVDTKIKEIKLKALDDKIKEKIGGDKIEQSALKTNRPSKNKPGN